MRLRWQCLMPSSLKYDNKPKRLDLSPTNINKKMIEPNQSLPQTFSTVHRNSRITDFNELSSKSNTSNSGNKNWITVRIKHKASELIKPLNDSTENLAKRADFLTAAANELTQLYANQRSEFKITQAMLEDSKRHNERLTKLNDALSTELARERAKNAVAHIYPTIKKYPTITEEGWMKSKSTKGSLGKSESLSCASREHFAEPRELVDSYKLVLMKFHESAESRLMSMHQMISEELDTKVKRLASITNTLTKGKLVRQSRAFELKLATLQWKCSPLHKLRVYHEKWFEILTQIIEQNLEKRIAPINYVCGQLNMLYAMRRSDARRIEQLIEDVKKRNKLILMMKKRLDKKDQAPKLGNEEISRQVENKVKGVVEAFKKKITEKVLLIREQIKKNAHELYPVKEAIKHMSEQMEEYKKRVVNKRREGIRNSKESKAKNNEELDAARIEIINLLKEIEELKKAKQELENKQAEDARMLLEKEGEINNKDQEVALLHEEIQNLQMALSNIIFINKEDAEKRDQEIEEYQERISELEANSKAALEVSTAKQSEDLQVAERKISELEAELNKFTEESKASLDKKNEELNTAQATISQIQAELSQANKLSKQDEEAAQKKIIELERQLKSSSEANQLGIEKKERELKNTQARLSELERQVKSAAESNSSSAEKKDKELKAAQAKTAELQKQLKTTSESTQIIIGKKDKELKSVQDRIVTLEKQLKSISEANHITVERKNKEIKSAQVKINELEKTLKEFSSKSQSSVAKQSEELRASQSKAAQLEKKLSETSELNQLAIKKKSEELKAATAKIEELEQKLKESLELNQAETTEKDEEIKIYSAKIEELKNKVEELKSSTKVLEENIREITSELVNKQENQSDKPEAALKAVKVKKPNDLTKEDDTLELSRDDESFLNDLQSSLESTKESASHIVQLKATLKGLRSKVGDLELLNARLQGRLKEAETNHQSVIQSVGELQQENAKLRTEVEMKLKSGASTCLERVMMSKIGDLQKKVQDVEAKLSAANKLSSEKTAELNSLTITCKALEMKNAAEKKQLKSGLMKLKLLMGTIDKIRNSCSISCEKLNSRLEKTVRKLFRSCSKIELTMSTEHILQHHHNRLLSMFSLKINSIPVASLRPIIDRVEDKVSRFWEVYGALKSSSGKKLEQVKTAVAACMKTLPLK
eukprot:TRINITY_DN1151_c0_g1_i4.p1 TRINITY_DN1151_c0_g1~~TRINITY_DN1151_c0_g1_i4.p1  ORF type:complete len:1178 (-),score=335.64 TRINITY_DN1151_c0_g1_i4:262-3795(-)